MESLKILFVENHLTFGEIVRDRFLSEHAVTIVPSIEQAVPQIDEQDYDLILVDYDLDDGKGDQVVRFARMKHPEIKIIGVSSHEQGNESLQFAGANRICSKLDFDNIAAIIGQLFSE